MARIAGNLFSLSCQPVVSFRISKLDYDLPISPNDVAKCSKLRQPKIGSDSDASLENETTVCRVSESLDKTRWKKSSSSCSLLSPFVPAVVAFFVHVNNVADSQLKLELTVRRIRHDATKSVNSFPVMCRIHQVESIN